MILAYLQSLEPLEQKTYVIKPIPELSLSLDEMFLFLTPLYGLSDSSELLYMTLDNHIQNYLVITPSAVHSVLYMNTREDGELTEMRKSYEDVRSGLLVNVSFHSRNVRMLNFIHSETWSKL